MSAAKYTPEEILQILTDSYNCQSVFDPEAAPGQELTFETTISDWRTICDLIEPKSLAKVYYDLFNLETPLFHLEDILLLKKNSLKVFCTYISDHAKKQTILPVIMMGQSCLTAAIFKTLISNLQAKGVKTEAIKPSSKFIPLFYKYGGVLLFEVNKLAPGSLTKFEYKDNRIVRAGWSIIGMFSLSIIIVPIIWHFHWSLLITLGIGFIVIVIGNRFKPEKINIGDYDTVRDLILGMQSHLKR